MGCYFVRAGGNMVAENMLISKGITLLANTGIFYNDINEWRLLKRKKTLENIQDTVTEGLLIYA